MPRELRILASDSHRTFNTELFREAMKRRRVFMIINGDSWVTKAQPTRAGQSAMAMYDPDMWGGLPISGLVFSPGGFGEFGTGDSVPNRPDNVDDSVNPATDYDWSPAGVPGDSYQSALSMGGDGVIFTGRDTVTLNNHAATSFDYFGRVGFARGSVELTRTWFEVRYGDQAFDPAKHAQAAELQLSTCIVVPSDPDLISPFRLGTRNASGAGGTQHDVVFSTDALATVRDGKTLVPNKLKRHVGVDVSPDEAAGTGDNWIGDTDPGAFVGSDLVLPVHGWKTELVDAGGAQIDGITFALLGLESQSILNYTRNLSTDGTTKDISVEELTQFLEAYNPDPSYQPVVVVHFAVEDFTIHAWDLVCDQYVRQWNAAALAAGQKRPIIVFFSGPAHPREDGANALTTAEEAAQGMDRTSRQSDGMLRCAMRRQDQCVFVSGLHFTEKVMWETDARTGDVLEANIAEILGDKGYAVFTRPENSIGTAFTGTGDLTQVTSAWDGTVHIISRECGDFFFTEFWKALATGQTIDPVRGIKRDER